MNTQRSQVRPPFITRNEIIYRADQLIRQYATYAKEAGITLDIFTINFDAIYEQVIYPEYGVELCEGIDLGFDNSGTKILGRYDADTNIAYIDASIDWRDPRRAFTCWHEVGGHAVLQGKWLQQQAQKRIQSSFVTTEASFDPQTTDILERQANTFASFAAAPSWFLDFVLTETYDLNRPIRYIGPARYCLDVRKFIRYYTVNSFDELCRIIASQIQFRFGGLSVEALSYRVQQSRWVCDETRKAIRLHRTPPRSPVRSIATVLAQAS